VNIDSGPDRFSYPFGTGIHIHIASESVFTSPRNQYSHAPESAGSEQLVQHSAELAVPFPAFMRLPLLANPANVAREYRKLRP